MCFITSSFSSVRIGFRYFFFGFALENTDFSLLLYVQTGSRSHPAPTRWVSGMFTKGKVMGA